MPIGGGGAGRRRAWPVIGTVGLALAAGCAGTQVEDAGQRARAEATEAARTVPDLGEELSAVRAELSRLREEVEALQAQGREAARTSATTAARQDEAIAALDRRLAASQRAAAEAAETVAALEATVGGLGDHVARMEALTTSPATERPAQGVAPRDAARARPAAPTADELFARASESLRAGELGQAVLDLEEFLAKYPGHPQVTTAKFWIAEAYFRAREFAQAAVEYQKVIDAPPGDKTPEALLKLGLSQRALRRDERARETWAQLIRDYPDSEAAQRARTALREPAQPAVR
jgi:tol-pal system protein YbgF